MIWRTRVVETRPERMCSLGLCGLEDVRSELAECRRRRCRNRSSSTLDPYFANSCWIIFWLSFCFGLLTLFFVSFWSQQRLNYCLFRSIFVYCLYYLLLWGWFEHSTTTQIDWMSDWITSNSNINLNPIMLSFYPIINLTNTHFSWSWQQQVDMFAHDREIIGLIKLIILLILAHMHMHMICSTDTLMSMLMVVLQLKLSETELTN